MKYLYLWRGWNKDKERICDCGTVWAFDGVEAERIAWMCIGGPHMLSIVKIQVELVQIIAGENNDRR